MPADAPPFPPPDAEPLDPARLDALRAELDARRRADRGPLASLRAWPTRRRRALFGLVLAALTALAARNEGSRAMALGLGAAAFVTGLASLRPIHRPSPPPWARRAVALGALALLTGVAFWVGDDTPAGWSAHLRCFGPGLALGVVVLAVWWALCREPLGFQALAAAAAAGLAANTFLAGGCSIRSTAHLLVGHASVPAVLLLTVWALDQRRALRD